MSQRKIESNRENAKKSTGPKSESGKAKVSRNATTLGMYTKDVVLPTEDVTQYNALRAAFHTEHQPETPTEEMLVDTIVIALWRRRRLQATEVGFHDFRICELSTALHKRYDVVTPNAEMANAVHDDYTGPRMLSDLWRHDARLERSIFRSLKELQRLKAQRPKRPDSTGPTEQESPNQTQTIQPPSIEPMTYETEPTPKSQIKPEPEPSIPPPTECIHKRLLSPNRIAFGGGLS